MPVLLFLQSGARILEAATGTIKVLYPNGGESLKVGSITTIRWQSQGLAPGAKVIIVLYKKGLKHTVIAKQTPNSGNYRWNISPQLPKANDYRIRIRSVKDLSVNDFSDRNFTLK